MYLAYIDEIGEPGAFVSRHHERYKTSAAFGYAGFVIPASEARSFGGRFQNAKTTLWRTEIAHAEHPGRWERKGASIFREAVFNRYPEQFRIFNALVGNLRAHGGHLFYYADEKPLGTPKQTNLDPIVREAEAMQQTLNRLARHVAQTAGQEHLLVMIDQVNEKTRRDRIATMYGHILSRAAEHPEMKRIIEPPMHIDSVLSANIQFADWIAACVGRAIDYQLIQDSQHRWITNTRVTSATVGGFTHESKLHFRARSIEDLHHSEIFRRKRPIYVEPKGQLVGGAVTAAVMRQIKAAAERRH